MVNRVQLTTKDNTNIAASYYPADSHQGIVLVHMMPADRTSWVQFAQKLQEAGYSALAIDLRGHGESGGGNYRIFTDRQHQDSIHDLEAAAEFLKRKGNQKIFFVGASIGANLALQYLNSHPETAGVALLSAGVDYRGIKIEPLIASVQDKNKILFVGAENDAETMGGSCADLVKNLGLTQSICLQHGGHGTNLLLAHLDLSDKIVEFLSKK